MFGRKIRLQCAVLTVEVQDEQYISFNNEKVNSARHNISCFYLVDILFLFHFPGIVLSMESHESDILVSASG